MRRVVVAGLISLVLAAWASGPSVAVGVGLEASPNPARVGDRVVHTVRVPVSGYLSVWVSAKGFSQPGMGNLPPGSWTWECCPSQTAGTPAWRYRSQSPVVPGTYRFGAVARTTGRYLSTASVNGSSAGVWIGIW